MHELSIASSLITLVEQQLLEMQPTHIQEAIAALTCKPQRVRSLHLKIGALSCVHRDALLFSFELASQGTQLEGAMLEIESVAVEVYCQSCQCTVTLESIQSFRCPTCNTPSADIRAGRELDLVSIELDDSVSSDQSWS